MHFLERKLSFFDSNSTEMCSLRSSCGPALVQIMATYKGIPNSRKCRLCPLVSSPFNILTHRGERPKNKTRYVNWLFIFFLTIPPPMPLYCKAWLKYRQTSNMRRTKLHNLNVSRLVVQLSLPNRLKPIRKWTYRWSSAYRRCSKYIWVINNFIACWYAHYIRGLTAKQWMKNERHVRSLKCHH